MVSVLKSEMSWWLRIVLRRHSDEGLDEQIDRTTTEYESVTGVSDVEDQRQVCYMLPVYFQTLIYGKSRT